MRAAVVRFARIVAAAALVAALDAALANIGLLDLPVWAIPVVAAALNAIAKYLRDRGWAPARLL